MSAIIYTRVSTEEQAAHGFSLDAQLAACTQYAQVHNLQVDDVIVDAGISGKSTDRPGFQKLLKLVVARKVKHVVAMKLDRLSRSTIDTLNLLNLMCQKRVVLHLTDSGIVDSTSADGELMMTLRAGFAQAERRKISERTKVALNRKRELGQRVSGKPPYGFEFKEAQIVANASEQGTLSVIRNLRREGLSVRQIIRDLDRRAIYNREGNQFSVSVIHKIVQAA